ncbi:uncharacterized protein LOC112590544 [Harpegnathos saltator]|uniref:uncharacterized protein LOC112590544 n=1 Tax=Harpegnathos saltator TaxID=610380 RepID=UPI000DBEDD21|nr:uncharacterized protein LOC112590544 [Harpegnathos saltator]
MDYWKHRRSPAPSEVSEDGERPTILPPPLDHTLSSEKSGEASAEIYVEHRAFRGQDGDPGQVSSPPNNVSFSTPVITATLEENLPDIEETEPNGLASELFGEQSRPPVAAIWSQIILNTTKSEVRTGLKEELRNTLL